MNDYEKVVIPFFRRTYRYSKVNDVFAVENDAFEFIQKSDFFNKKDRLVADVLVQELEDRNLIKFEERKNDIRYFRITLSGINLINR